MEEAAAACGRATAGTTLPVPGGATAGFATAPARGVARLTTSLCSRRSVSLASRADSQALRSLVPTPERAAGPAPERAWDTRPLSPGAPAAPAPSWESAKPPSRAATIESATEIREIPRLRPE
ncbi:hypothetical protein GCM10020221_16740 [Streptomyces thioluteus]|uniref:Uncharacterized protein n=1 Tax=Streptomyces thioluteus TaxID=66431 RepID=A0ABP6J6W6_STRTU